MCSKKYMREYVGATREGSAMVYKAIKVRYY